MNRWRSLVRILHVAGGIRLHAWPVPVLFAMVACSAPEPVPADLLPRDRFRDALLKAHLVEARLNHEMMVDKRMDMPAAQYYDTLFDQEGITREQFLHTFNWYADHPGDMKALYEEVLATLQHRADSIAH